MTELVALPIPPTAAAIEALRALWARGHAVLPLDPAAPSAARELVLAVARPHRLATPDLDAAVALPDPWPISDDVALVVATSGSTGRPKAATLTTAALEASTRASLARLGCRSGEVWRIPLPLHHIAGLQALRRSWALGIEPDVVDPGDLSAITAPGADHVALVPTQLHRLVEAGASPLPGVALLGGGSASPTLVTSARTAGWRVVMSYGMTETCGGCVYDGFPLDGVDVEVAGEERIRIRGPVLFSGYRGQPAPGMDADGWFTTDDLGYFDEDGRLEVVGRTDDVIVTGGENVPAPAVAAALRSHDRVTDAAVLGRPDPVWGQRVVAVVVAADPAEPPTLSALRDHVRRILPATHAPKELVLVPHLPRDSLGKLRRRALIQQMADKPAAERRGPE